MCNLNIFVKTHTKNSDTLKRITSLLEVSTRNSFINNSDGDGFYFDYKNKLVKSKKKINLLKYGEHIQNSKFILSHQRFTTQGREAEYIQPFKDNGFIFMHNGVLRNYPHNKHSDTYLFFEAFNKAFEKAKGKTREEKLLTAIKPLLEQAEGTFSICLFDIKNKNMYYVKNGSTLINFYMTKKKDELFISTKDNEDLLNIYNTNFEEYDINPYIIYKINIKNKKIILQETEKINNTQKSVYNGYSSGYTTKSNIKHFSNVTYINNSPYTPPKQKKHKTPLNYFDLDFETKSFLLRAGYELKHKLKKCCLCKARTDIYAKWENKYYCYDCIEELYI